MIKVIIVDDHPVVRRGLKEIIEDEPDMEVVGETMAALRKISPAIPVVLTSGYDKAQVMSGDHPEWPQAFLGKPYMLKGLSDAIHLAMAKKD